MFDMTKKIYKALSESKAEFKVFTDDDGEQSSVWLQFGTKNGSSYRIRFISRDNDNDVAVRVYGLFQSMNQKEMKYFLSLIT